MNLSMHFSHYRLVLLTLLLTSLLSPLRAETQRIRVMASNLTSENFQSYQIHGERILEGCAPDIVAMQEFTIGDSASQSASTTNSWVSSVFGAGYYWSREPGDEQIPNGIISRWPIIESGEWEDTAVSNRDFAYARIDIPGEPDMWVVSVHLLTANASTRSGEASALRTLMQNHGIPADDYVVIAGDFNTSNRSEGALSTLQGYLGGSLPYSKDQSGNDGTNASRSKPYDWVLVDTDLAQYEVSVDIVSGSFPTGFVVDTRVINPISAISPAQTGDSGASNMQHMGVIRDFVVPSAADDFALSGEVIDFGTRNAIDGPFDNSTINIEVTQSFTLNSVQMIGTDAAEFSLVTPAFLPRVISSDTPLQLRWNPATNDNRSRSVIARLNTGGTPASVDIALSGKTLTAYTLSDSVINFGTRNADDGPFTDNSIQIYVNNPIDLTGVSFSGGDGAEFSLVSPDLSGGAVEIDATTPLVFAWNPSANEDRTHTTTASFTTDATPSGFNISLSGTTMAAYAVNPTSVDFGEVDAADGAFSDNSVELSVADPLSLESVSFSGTYASEFSLVSPDLSGGAVEISTATPLVFAWTPASNNNIQRTVTANFSIDAEPSNFIVTLTGTPVSDYTVATNSVNFGSGRWDSGPYNENVLITVNRPINITGLSFAGAYAGEFSIVSPDLGTLPRLLTGNTTFSLRWTPAVNDGQSHIVTLNVTTDGEPADFAITLQGSALLGGTGEPLDISGYEIEQANSSATYTVPSNTILAAGQRYVVGRDASQSAFESSWGVSLGSDVIYDSGMDVIGGNGFPVINGDETFTLRNASSILIEGPTPNLTSGNSQQRLAADASATSSASWQTVSDTSATPGTYTGSEAGTGQLIISEYSDADSYFYEFVELFYDAAATPPPAAPGAPQDVTAQSTDDTVTIGWEAVSATGLQGYNVYRTSVEEGPYEKITAKPITTTSFEDNTVAPGIEYFYIVRTIAQDIESVNSEVVSGGALDLTPEDITNYLLGITSNPDGLDINGDGDVDIADVTMQVELLPPFPVDFPTPADGASDFPTTSTLIWGAGERADTFNLYLWPSTENQPGSPSASGLAEKDYLPLSPLDSGTEYRWQVNAVGNGEEVEGPIWSFTTRE